MDEPGNYDLILGCDGVYTTSAKKLEVLFINIIVATPTTALKATDPMDLVITVAGIPTDLCATVSDFSVYLEKDGNGHIIRMKPSNCVYANAVHTITVHFPGGPVGAYTLNVFHALYGLVAMKTAKLRIGPTVTGMDPISGSLYGGTLITIAGENFEASDSIKFQNSPCAIQSFKSTEIKCLTPVSPI